MNDETGPLSNPTFPFLWVAILCFIAGLAMSFFGLWGGVYHRVLLVLYCLGGVWALLAAGYAGTYRATGGRAGGQFGKFQLIWLLILSAGIIYANIMEARWVATGLPRIQIDTMTARWRSYGNACVVLFLMSLALTPAKWVRAIQKSRAETKADL